MNRGWRREESQIGGTPARTLRDALPGIIEYLRREGVL